MDPSDSDFIESIGHVDPPAALQAEQGESSPMLITADMLAAEEAESGRIDFEKGMSYAPLLTLLLIAVNAIVFGWELYVGALDHQASIIAAGALFRPRIVEGEAWRLVSCMFLHASAGHLIGNCLILYVLGVAAEHGVGRKQTLYVYFISGLCGSLLSVTAGPGPSVGASGAIFGVLGCVIVFLYRHRSRFFVREKRTGLVLLLWAAWQVLMGFLSPDVDNFAHLGGLVGGAVGGALVVPRIANPAAGGTH